MIGKAVTAMQSNFQEVVKTAIGRGIDFLLQEQDADGFWREFDLPPGASESWTTAWVGWCLTRAVSTDPIQQFRVRKACSRAARAVWETRCPGGWGYNHRTGPDADSTAWVLRFLNACGAHIRPTEFLLPYIDPGGGVHTFREARYRSWTNGHDDVAANAGLALFASTAANQLVSRIQDRLVRRFPVETFWWSTPTYGIAWTLCLLSASGSLSQQIRQTAFNWIGDLSDSMSSFEIAHRLMAVSQMEPTGHTARTFVDQLLDLVGLRGWAGSSFLLVPSDDTDSKPPPNSELRGLLTTALCIRTLSDWFGSNLHHNGGILGLDEVIRAT